MRLTLLTLTLVALLSSTSQCTPIATSQELLEVIQPDHVSGTILPVDDALRRASSSSRQGSFSDLCRRNDPPQDLSWTSAVSDFFGVESYTNKKLLSTVAIRTAPAGLKRWAFLFTQTFQPGHSYLFEISSDVVFTMRVLASRNGKWIEGPSFEPFFSGRYAKVPVAVHEPVQMMLVFHFDSTVATGELRLSEVTPNFNVLYRQKDLEWPFGLVSTPAVPASAPAAASPAGAPSPAVESSSGQAKDTWGSFGEWSDDGSEKGT